MRVIHWAISIFILVSPNLYADAWRAELVNGSKLETDPQTRKPMVNHNGNPTPLWDGVHTLQDGSIVIVRDGIVIPNENIYQAWSAVENSYKTELKLNDCEILVRRVCGLKNGCSSQKACDLAKQLQQLWENASDKDDNGLSFMGKNECHLALTDSTAFPPCEKEAKSPVACARLVTRACGKNDECNASKACNVARQLLDLTRETALKNAVATDNVDTEQYCHEAMNNHFFSVCRQQP